MTNVFKLFGGGSITPAISNDVHEMDNAIVEAIQNAINTGVPQGLIVAILHGHSHQQTNNLINNE